MTTLALAHTALTLAWRPFLDPLQIHSLWFVLLVPLALGISIGYRAVRVASFEHFWFKVSVLTVQIVVSMILLGVASYFFIQILVPMLLPMPQ